jgi:hypothetical protein
VLDSDVIDMPRQRTIAKLRRWGGNGGVLS